MKNLYNLNQWLKKNGFNSHANHVSSINSLYKYAVSKEEVNNMKEWLGDDYSKLSFNDLFGGKLRIAIPFAPAKQTKMIEIVNFLKSNGWLPSSPDDTFRLRKVKQKLRRLDTGEEYEEEITVPELKVKRKERFVIPTGPEKGREIEKEREVSISKVLSNPRSEAPDWMSDWWQQNQAEYAKDFNWKQIETAFKKSYLDSEYSIIISRDPIDILRMSDYNNIRSCHSEGGGYFECAIHEAKGNGLIAYLVKTSDLNQLLREKSIDRYYEELGKVKSDEKTLNMDWGERIDLDSKLEGDIDINDISMINIGDLDKLEIFADPRRRIKGIVPKARVRLRKYVSDEGYDFAAPESRTYGSHPPGFVNEVRRWSWENQKQLFKVKSESDNLTIPDAHDLTMYGGSYRDTSDGEILNNFFESGGIETKFRGDVRTESEDVRTESEGVGLNRFDIWNEELERFQNEANSLLKHTSVVATAEYNDNFDEDDNLSIYAHAHFIVSIPLHGWKVKDGKLYSEENLEVRPSLYTNIEMEKMYKIFEQEEVPDSVDVELNLEKKELSLTFTFSREDFENPDDVQTFFITMQGIDEEYDIYFGKITRILVDEGFIAPNEFQKMRINLKDIKFKNLEVDFEEDANKIYISSRDNIYPEEVYVFTKLQKLLSSRIDFINLRFKLYDILNTKINTQIGLGILKDETLLILESINDILRKSYDYSRNQVTFDFYKSDNELLQEYPPLIDYFYVALDSSGEMPFTLCTHFTVIINAITSDDHILIIQDFLKKLDQYNDFIFEKINESIKSKLDKDKRDNILLMRDLYSGKLSLPIINEFKNIKHNKHLKRLALWIEENWDNFSNAEKEVAHYKYLVPISQGLDVFFYTEGEKVPLLWEFSVPNNTNSSLSSMSDIDVDAET